MRAQSLLCVFTNNHDTDLCVLKGTLSKFKCMTTIQTLNYKSQDLKMLNIINTEQLSNLWQPVLNFDPCSEIYGIPILQIVNRE